MSITELEEWFASAPKPIMPIYLNAATKVTDYEEFVSAHFQGIHTCDNPKIRQPMIDRLLDMKLMIEASQD